MSGCDVCVACNADPEEAEEALNITFFCICFCHLGNENGALCSIFMTTKQLYLEIEIRTLLHWGKNDNLAAAAQCEIQNFRFFDLYSIGKYLISMQDFTVMQKTK